MMLLNTTIRLISYHGILYNYKFANLPAPVLGLIQPTDQSREHALSVFLPFHSSLSKPIFKILGQHDIKITRSSATTFRNLLTKTTPANQLNHTPSIINTTLLYIITPSLHNPHITLTQTLLSETDPEGGDM